MSTFPEVLQQGAASTWLFIPTAVLLGALHGLEPGHSKTMMAAFIIAIRGTVRQAVLLGLSAAISHSLIIWLLAAAALRYGANWNIETTEPYFQLASALAIAALAVWMFRRTRRDLHAARIHHHSHEPDAVLPHEPSTAAGHAHDHGHHCGEGHHHMSHHNHDHEHDHQHQQPHEHGSEFEDEHQAAHALDIRQRFAARAVTTPQIILFGLTGGLMPCPAAVTVLLVCLQLKKVSLGLALVGAFSFGLAITMVSVGATAAWSVQHAQRRFRGFGELMRQAPYLSCVLLLALASYFAWQGWRGLAGQ